MGQDDRGAVSSYLSPGVKEFDPNALVVAKGGAEAEGRRSNGNCTQIDPNKNPHAVALGRLGGLKGGIARAAKLAPKKRSQIAAKAAKTRWGKKP